LQVELIALDLVTIQRKYFKFYLTGVLS